jgi:hypothetical protein
MTGSTAADTTTDEPERVVESESDPLNHDSAAAGDKQLTLTNGMAFSNTSPP